MGFRNFLVMIERGCDACITAVSNGRLR